MTRVVVACCLGLLLGAPYASVQEKEAANPDRGMLAVLRRDGILVPFAAFKGDDWSTPWPIDLRNRELPVSLGDVPAGWWGGKPPTGWHARLTNGTDIPINLQALAPFPAFCQSRIGIKTNYRSSEPVPPVPVVPFPKDGLAVTSGVEIEPIEAVDRTSPEAAKLVLALARYFEEIEEKTLGAIQHDSGWNHPVTKSERQKVPVKVEAWYRAPINDTGSMASYIEAVRAYRPRPEDEGCGLETLFSGWVIEDMRESKGKIELSAKVTYCDRVGGMYMLPFGRIRLKDRQFWVFQYSGWDQEWYSVVRVMPRRVFFEAEFYAGGRRGCLPPRI